MFDAYLEKARFVKHKFKKFSAFYSFFICNTATIKINTIFFKKIRKKVGGMNWLSINTTQIFVGTMPTFKLRIFIFDNVGNQNFYKELIVESTKILTNSLTF